MHRGASPPGGGLCVFIEPPHQYIFMTNHRGFIQIPILVALIVFGAVAMPVFVSAQTEGVAKPGTFFYLIDTAFEKVGLFFTFNPEKKARKALGYADKRLAQIGLIDETEKPTVVESLIANYESNIALAIEKTKGISDKEKADGLFASIAENTSKNQEALSAVMAKVPEEAKGAIAQAIEVSKKNQEEALQQITELKKEVGELREEVKKLKEELQAKEEKETEIDFKPTVKSEEEKPPISSFRVMESAEPQEEKVADEPETLSLEEIKQNNVAAITQAMSLLEDAKRNWEKIYGAIETNKRVFLESELRFLDSRVSDLSQSISSITDCSISVASDMARVNTTYDNRVIELKRIYQKNIDSRRAYGQEESAVLQEQELAEKVSQIERERDTEIEKIKAACESGLGLLKTSLQIVLDSTKRGRNDVAEYTNLYSTLQETVKKEITSIGMGWEKAKNGQYEEAVSIYDSHHSKIRSIALQLNQLNSSVGNRASSVESNYKRGVDSAFRNSSIVQGISSELNAISDRALTYADEWRRENTPMKCNAVSEFVSEKTKTRITCEGISASIQNPIRCYSKSEWLFGQLRTRMTCEQN